jgi:hypothetical protein
VSAAAAAAPSQPPVRERPRTRFGAGAPGRGVGLAASPGARASASAGRRPRQAAARFGRDAGTGSAIASSYARTTSSATRGHANRSVCAWAASAIRARRGGSPASVLTARARASGRPGETRSPSSPWRTISR